MVNTSKRAIRLAALLMTFWRINADSQPPMGSEPPPLTRRDGDRRIASRTASAESKFSLRLARWRYTGCPNPPGRSQAETDRSATGSVRAGRPKGGKRCVKADSPTSASLSKGCTTDLTATRAWLRSLRDTRLLPGFAAARRSLAKSQDGFLKRSPKSEFRDLH